MSKSINFHYPFIRKVLLQLFRILSVCDARLLSKCF